jgi:8-oxo-dGTP diphosphatase
MAGSKAPYLDKSVNLDTSGLDTSDSDKPGLNDSGLNKSGIVNSAGKLANFRVGVENVIFSVDMGRNRLLVLLILADNNDESNNISVSDRWSLPHTLVRESESLEQAAYRTLAEKIRAENLYLEQLYTFDNQFDQKFDHLFDRKAKPTNSPLINPEINSKVNRELANLSVSYFAIVRFEEAELIAAESVSNSQNGIAWYPIEQIPKLSLNHQRILEYGHRRLKNKLEYSPVAFDVLPDTFTLSDLFQFYTTILGEDFSDYSNFRSRLLKLGFLIDTGIKVTRGAGRPASLYRFDPLRFSHFKDQPMVFI